MQMFDTTNPAVEVSGGSKDGKLLTWDQVHLSVTDYGKSVGLMDLLFKDTVHINIEVCAGEVANAIVTCCTECKSLEE